MKKLLLVFVAAAFSGLSAMAQCTPDPQFTEPGVYPDSATGFANACANVAYEEIITVIVPVDTTVDFGGIPVTLPFDSVVVESIVGLPPGFTYSCNSPQNTTSPTDGCAFEGGTTGCVSIVGNPTTADIATYNLTITVSAYLGGSSTPAATEVLDYYSIVVENCGSAGLQIQSISGITLSPNPANELLNISGLPAGAALTVLSADGKMVTDLGSISGAKYTMNVSGLQSGVYFLQVRQGDATEVIRFVKQ